MDRKSFVGAAATAIAGVAASQANLASAGEVVLWDVPNVHSKQSA